MLEPAPFPDADRLGPELRELWPTLVAWVEPHRDHVHLFHAVRWLLTIEPDASEPLVVAALTHDVERMYPGGTQPDKAAGAWDDVEYLRMHSRRSADIVMSWLREHDAPEELVQGVETPILEHEVGGSPGGDLAQASDSLSFLEVNGRLVASWVLKGETSLELGIKKLDWMYERIRLDRARSLARPLHERVVAETRRLVAEAA